MLLKNKTAVITGCNKGIGYGIIERLCARNDIPNLVMACRN